jgi:hypothetical protein
VALAAVQQTVYVCDAAGSAIRSLQLRDNAVQTCWGRGRAPSATSDGPRNNRRSCRIRRPIALDPDAPMLWILDSGNDRLRSLRLAAGPPDPHACRSPSTARGSWRRGRARCGSRYRRACRCCAVDPKTGAVQHIPIGE